MGMLDRWRDKPEPKSDQRPRAASGRAHTNGFLDLEELNPDLVSEIGLKTFDRMYRTDGDVRQALALVANPMIAGTWDVEPHGGIDADQNALDDADFVRWALFDVMSPNLTGHLEELLPVLLRSGFTPFEELWTTATWDKDSKEYLVLRKLDMRLPRTVYRWFQDAYGDLYSIVQQLPVPLSDLAVGVGASNTITKASNGETLMPNEVELLASKISYYRIGREGDNWEGVSMLRPAYKHWLIKDAIERIDAIGQEREAIGIPICYPPLSATPTQLDEMEIVLSNMRTNEQGYIIMPGPKAGAGAADGQGWLVEILGFDRTGSGRDPAPSLAYHTQKIYAAVIAEFIRLGHETTGARATAQVQVEPFLQSIEAMSRCIEEALQKLVDKLIAYNRPKAKASPKISLSKIDATSLTQLADYVMKLGQAGALLPDQALEEYLRMRADLPPMDPDAVKSRGKGAKADTDLRKEIATGGGAFGDAMGGNKPAGGSGKATPSSANKTKPSKSLDGLEDGFHDEKGRRLRYRAYRPEEDIVNLDGIEDFLDDLPDHFAREMQDHIVDCSTVLAQGGKLFTGTKRKLNTQLCQLLSDSYHEGAADANNEVNTLYKRPVTLSSFRDKGPDAIKALASHAADEIVSKMQLAAEASKLNHGDDATAETQAATEAEGFRGVRAAALGHGSSAYQQGRHDTFLDAGDEFGGLRLVYTSMLDNRVCDKCEEADDGVPRKPGDPVRLDNRPPNRHCLSNLGGHNYCRCLEIMTVV